MSLPPSNQPNSFDPQPKAFSHHKLTFADSHSCLFKKHWGLEAGICLRSYINSKLFPGTRMAFKTSSFLPITTFGNICHWLKWVLTPTKITATSPALSSKAERCQNLNRKFSYMKIRDFYPSRKSLGAQRGEVPSPTLHFETCSHSVPRPA